MKPILAGLLSGLVLDLAFILYLLVRGRILVAFFCEQDESISRMPEKDLFAIILGGFVLAGLAFGAISGWVYALIGSPAYFIGLAFGLAILFSILALVSKQPLIPDKIAWNLAVGGLLGLLVPLLAL